MDFWSMGLFWLFFALVGVFMFLMEFGFSGQKIIAESVSQLFMMIGGLALTVIVILAFIFMWWQGGVAILVSTIIWFIIAFIVGNIVRDSIMRRRIGRKPDN